MMSGKEESRGEMKEGFLCPICMIDLGDLIQLQLHFEEKHSKEDPIFLQNIKGLFGKAKKKFDLASSAAAAADPDSAFELLTDSFGGGVLPEHEPVSGVHSGARVDIPVAVIWHTADFKAERKKRLDRNTAATQVLFRLEKLLKDLPSDPVKRRQYEQSVVPWIDEDLIDKCPNCGQKFIVAIRRKHHCRLCGGVLCAGCSFGVGFDFARRIVDPINAGTESGGGGKRGGNFITDFINEKQFRICKVCKDILDGHESRAEAAQHSALVALYETLKGHMVEGRVRGQEYRRLVDTLYQGDEDFTLKEGEVLRVKLLKIADNIDSASKAVEALPSESDLERIIQKKIRSAAVNFIKECLVGLPGVPSEEEFEALKRQRVSRAAAKVEEEKMAAKVAKLRFEQQQQQQQQRQQQKVSSSAKSKAAPVMGSGFVVASSSSSTTSEDPMVQQIHNLREFIAQARRMGKADEVAALEASLSELRAEFARIQRDRERSELERNFESFKGVFHKQSTTAAADRDESCDNDQEQEYVDIDEYDASGKNPFL